MAYSELIKNFNRIRAYMREFYVYGFKRRTGYTKKSARSYDDERRRLESWMGEDMQFRQTPEGKTVFLSIDSRVQRHNPLFAAWKAKSFTDGDITLHFILFDLLYAPEVALSLSQIMAGVDDYLQAFACPRLFDASTVRKKLNEYRREGLVLAEKRGKTLYYRRAETAPPCSGQVLDFFSEVAPCGVVGAYLLDRQPPHRPLFAFKHHYITGAMDSEIVCTLLTAMGEKRCVTLETVNRHRARGMDSRVVPLRLMISAQNGRQYIMAYSPQLDRITPVRTDRIVTVTVGEPAADFDRLRATLDGMAPHIWGVSTQSTGGARMEHVEFTITYGDDEPYILRRLLREKRCGTVEQLDKNTAKFSADVYDSSELVPWIRTFICRITDLHFSNPALEDRFRQDLTEMYALYGLEGGDGL